MIIQELKKSIPEQNTFVNSLTGNGKYHFLEWNVVEIDKLSYWFWSKDKTKKRVKFISLSEFEKLLQEGITKNNRVIERSDFNRTCSNTFKCGPCGFCIMIRLMEILNIGNYLGKGKGVEITNRNKLERLIN